MTEEEQSHQRLVEAAREFDRKMRENEVELPPGVARVLDENFWDLVSTKEK